MTRFLIRLGVFLAAAAVGIVAAALLLDGFDVQASGFIITVVLYAVVQSSVTPLFSKFAETKANAFVGGAGLVATFIALLVTSWFGRALDISGISTWLWATLIVWLASAFATILIPLALVKAGVTAARTTT